MDASGGGIEMGNEVYNGISVLAIKGKRPLQGIVNNEKGKIDVKSGYQVGC